MRLQDLDMLILKSSIHDWEGAVSPPSGPYPLQQAITGMHIYPFSAVYRHNIDIHMAWRDDPNAGAAHDLDFGYRFPDRSQSLQICDVFHESTLARRFQLVVADGGKITLPMPHRRLRPNTTGDDPDDFYSLATAVDVHVARLVHTLSGRTSDFDAAIDRHRSRSFRFMINH